ncbi:MAG: hypothetical protein HY671_05200 [Chloroflexi bacterium]|nr:hypothetical protein [Chloroflexota bacterium]
MEAVVDQIESEILQQMLRVPLEDLPKTFSSLLPRFSSLGQSLSNIMVSQISDVSELSQISATGLSEMKEQIEKDTSGSLGRDSINELVSGAATVSILIRGAMKRPEMEIEDAALAELQGWLIAYWLSLCSVVHYLFEKKGHRQNARVLAEWSRYYAAGAYRVAKGLKLLQVPSIAGDAPESDEEDMKFSGASIAAVAHHLEDGGE